MLNSVYPSYNTLLPYATIATTNASKEFYNEEATKKVEQLYNIFSSKPQFSGSHGFYQSKKLIDTPSRFISVSDSFVTLTGISETTYINAYFLELNENTVFQKYDNAVFICNIDNLIIFTTEDRSGLFFLDQSNGNLKKCELAEILKDDPIAQKINHFYILECVAESKSKLALILRDCFIILLDLEALKGEVINFWQLDDTSLKSSEINNVCKFRHKVSVSIRHHCLKYENTSYKWFTQKISDIFNKNTNQAQQINLENDEVYRDQDSVYFRNPSGIKYYNGISMKQLQINLLLGRIIFGNYQWTVIENPKTHTKEVFNYSIKKLDLGSSTCFVKIYNSILISANTDSLNIYIKYLHGSSAVIKITSLMELFKSKSISMTNLRIKDIAIKNNLCYCLVINEVSKEYYVVKFELSSGNK